MRMMLLIFVIYYYYSLMISSLAQQITQEHQLYKHLMTNYEPSVRPVKDFHSRININFRLKLTQILELSEKDQTLTTNVWIEQEWFDEHLKWNLDDYKGIRSLRMPSNKIWLPDTYIYNIASSQDGAFGTITGPYAMLRNDGRVKYPVPMRLKSNCEVDITYFPFDQQICYIKFASWIYDLSAINFTTLSEYEYSNLNHTPADNADQKRSLPHFDLSSFTDSSGWILLNVRFLRRERILPSGVYPELIYFIHIKRRYLYYIFNVIIPCGMLSVLTCMTFWLPCLSGEKVTMGLTCFVAYSVFMLMVAEKVPATSEIVPIISIYLTIVMSFTSLSVMMAVFVTNMHERTKTCTTKAHRVPRLVRHICMNYLAKFLGMQENSKRIFKLVLKGYAAKSPADKNNNHNNEYNKRKNNEISGYKQSRFTGGGCGGVTSLDQSRMAQDESREFHYTAVEFLKMRNVIERNLFDLNECDIHKHDHRHHHGHNCHHQKQQQRFKRVHESSNDDDWIAEEQQQRKQLPAMTNSRATSTATSRTTFLNPSIKLNDLIDAFKTSDSEAEDQQPDGQHHDLDGFNETIFSISSSNNNSNANRKKKNNIKNNKYKIRKDYMPIYLSYEWVLVGLVLDRFFFWFYTTLVFLSYITTLYIFPFLIQTEYKDDHYYNNVP